MKSGKNLPLFTPLSDNHPVGKTQDSLRVLLGVMEKYYGIKPMIYGTNRSFNTICGADFKGYNACIVQYGKKKPVLKGPNNYHCYIWQYSETGKVNGITKGLDLWHFHKNADITEIFMPKSSR